MVDGVESGRKIKEAKTSTVICCDVVSEGKVNWPYTSLAEIAPLDPPSPKTPPRTKHEVDRTTGCGDMAI